MDIQELIENFEIMDDWEDKYAYLISLGKQLPEMDDVLKTENTKVSGCLSQVWLALSVGSDGSVVVIADSDAQIVRGLVAIIYIALDGKTVQEVSQVDIRKVFQEIGLDQHLSPNRRNGFFSMLNKVESFIVSNN